MRRRRSRFMATYTPRLSAHGKAQHLPLKHALAEYSDGRSKAQLLSLLLPVQRAAEQCDWLREMVDAGEIYHPLRWTPADAWRLLKDDHQLEAAGIVVRAPGNWQAGRPARPQVKSHRRRPSAVRPRNGRAARLPHGTHARRRAPERGRDQGAAQGGGRLAVDPRPLGRSRSQEARQSARALRGHRTSGRRRWICPSARRCAWWRARRWTTPITAADADWSQLTAGPWLAEILRGLRQPEGLAQVDPGAELKADLRPYQQAGVRWLYLLTRLRLGACLADDMGLGKTMQVLSLLLVLKREQQGAARPSLLVAPASLLANWAAEAERFAPSLRLLIAHPSVMPAAELRALDAAQLADIDLVVTSYGTLLRLPALDGGALVRGGGGRSAGDQESRRQADAAGQDSSKPTRASRSPARRWKTGCPTCGRSSISLTRGCWARTRSSPALPSGSPAANSFGPLRALVRPYILRRMKTDKRGDRRPAGQDRTQGVVSPEPAAGSAVPAGGEGSRRARWKTPTGSGARAWCFRS